MRLGLPEPTQHRGRLNTTVEMFGEPHLGDPDLGGRLHIGLDVPFRVLTGRRPGAVVRPVGMEMDVVVTHGGGGYPSSGFAGPGVCGMVIPGETGMVIPGETRCGAASGRA